MAGDARVVLDVNFEVRTGGAEQREWWRDPSVLGAILRASRELGLWLGFKYVGREGAKPLTEIGSLDELISMTTSWEDRGYVLHTQRNGGLDGNWLTLSLRASLLRLMLGIEAEQVRAQSAVLCERLIELAARAHAAFRDRAWVAENSGVGVTDLERPSVRPPREHSVLALGGLVTFVDPAFFVERGKRFPEEHLESDLKKLRSAALPAGATREEHDGLLVFRWLDEPLSEASMARACVRGEKWFGETLDMPPQDGWNRAGDQEVDVSGYEPHPPITLYSADEQRGYKTLAVTKQGKIPEPALAELSAWAATGQLPDGAPLAELGVIVPAREAALRTHARLLESGLAQVVYTDGDGALWDPFPEGEWSE